MGCFVVFIVFTKEGLMTAMPLGETISKSYFSSGDSQESPFLCTDFVHQLVGAVYWKPVFLMRVQ